MLAVGGLNLEEFFTGPEFLTVLAQFISAFFTTLAVGILGRGFGTTAA